MDGWGRFREQGGKAELPEDELVEWHEITSEIHSLSRLNASICWQQSRSSWLKEGDANSKYFHFVLASRRRVGSIYKILAKVLANRLRMVIGSVISESQTAFVKDRQILDGILIANEVVDEAHVVMGRTYFRTLWMKWIKECVSTTTTSVLVNGSPIDEFPLDIGLRQGYNIGVQNPLSVSHLQFADDTLLLGTKSWANVPSLRDVLVQFESMSRLQNLFWLVMAKIRDGVGGLGGGWFRESVVRQVGDGSETFFWSDPCLDVYFRMGDRGGGVGLEVSVVGVGGGDVGGVSGLTSYFTFAGSDFKCLAVAAYPVTGYSVRRAYQLLTSHDPVTLDAAGDLIWHKQVPLKVSVLAWRLLRDRLPMKANLVIRGIISPEAHFCVSGCGGIETAQHLLFTCGTFDSLWSVVRSWIDLSSVDPQNPSDHFLQFIHLAGGRRA
ncbi:hypothetical protein TSUD_296060 [Trifolium subterraneum]|uniref:Reverse transcriptase zinc-binding domain-containing protein n=1 Tax=Trifolium subterraneum TaxID=3900 RepID=A0A2Z6N031_TRISU|nr:hypothetical protein TSUD_296060 [Trifolium subterraneum]